MTYYSRITLGMQCFSGPMAELEGAIRRDRRPLPVLEIAGATYRQWAAAVLRAEMKHATDDFWRCVYARRAGLLFDHYQREREAGPFRFDHEVRARAAYAWLSDLNMHEGVKHGAWATWKHLNDAQRLVWRVHWFHLARGFLQRTTAYRAAK